MKIQHLAIIACSALTVAACGGQENPASETQTADSLQETPAAPDTLAMLNGVWHIDSLISEKNSLSECEKNMNFEFSSDEGEVMSGISTRVLKVSQGSENPCDFAGPNDNYESSYALVYGFLYIKNLQLDKKQFSGTFKINDISEHHLSLTSLKQTFYFSK